MAHCNLTSKQDKLCNKCGKTVFVGQPGEEKHSFGMMDAKASFGYFDSDPAAGMELGFYDGDTYRFSLCAKCLKNLFDTFYIFPEMSTSEDPPLQFFTDYTQEPDETEAKWANIRLLQKMKNEKPYSDLSSVELMEQFFAERTLCYLDKKHSKEMQDLDIVLHRAMFKEIQIRKSAEWSDKRDASASVFEKANASSFLRKNAKNTQDHKTKTAEYKFCFYVNHDENYYSVEQIIDKDRHFVPPCILKHTDPEAYDLFLKFYKEKT